MTKILPVRIAFLLVLRGHKFVLIIWPFPLEFMLVTETCFSLKDRTKEEKQTLKLIRALVLCFPSICFPKACHFKK